MGKVSRIEVREGTMKAPDSVVSQNRWFCEVSIPQKGPRWDETYIFVVDDDSLALCNVDAICLPDPPLPEHPVDPSKSNLLLVFFANVDLHALRNTQSSLITSVLGFFKA